MANFPVHARFDGPIVMIGFGSIGRGTLPLLERHIQFDRSKFVVIDPVDTDRGLLDERKLKFIKVGLTKANYREVLTPLLKGGPGRGMIVNVSVDTSSVDLMDALQGHRLPTTSTPSPSRGRASTTTRRSRCRSDRTMRLRERVLDVRRRTPGRRHRGELLRRQSRHGVLVRQAGAARCRPRHRGLGSRSRRPARTGRR